jgi:SPP1 gp7 family putative phage head morphogenesis protein
VAREIGRLIEGFPPGEVTHIPALRNALQRYSELLEPWAKQVSERLFDEISQQDDQTWKRHGREMGRGLLAEIQGAPTGQAAREFLATQVELIKSLPLEAGERVQRLALESLTSGVRADALAAEILRTGEVTASRATLIARTEIARAASALTMARAQHIGSEGYLWRTSKDSDVRESHGKMEGVFVYWDKPPALNEGTKEKPRIYHAHAGQIFNCRCFMEPVIPDDFD